MNKEIREYDKDVQFEIGQRIQKMRLKDAKACYKMNRLVLVNLDILDEYLETFHIEDEEFYK